MSSHRIRFSLNGTAQDREVPAHRLLIDLLRDEIGATGTKEGCSVGVCGLCAVLVDGHLVSACLMPAVYVDGAEVTTIEGIAPADGALAPLQDAFIAHGGFQCGICTPGQIVSATALLRERPRPSEGDVREWMKGSLCRCTGYEGILKAILVAAEAGPA